MAQFTDPTKPAGESRWGSYIGGSLKYMHWDNGPVLVVNNIEVGPSTGIRFCFDWDGGHFYGLPSAGSVSADTYFDVVHSSSAQEFTVPSLDETYICDLYLDIINNKAKVVAKAKKDANITLYFGLTDREMSHVYFYTFGDWYNHAWTGAELTDHEEINRIKYYKAVVPGTKIWDKNVNIIINDGSWQTNDFTTADWSGFKSEYYFNVVGKNIVQLSGRPAAVNITIDGNFDDWAQISGNVTGPNSKFNTTTMKAYSDGTHMFIYTKVETGSGGDHSGLGDGDIKFFFDKDNDATTGDTSTWYRIGADDTDNEFRVKLASESLRSVLADASYHASVKVTDDTTNRVMEMELKFDLAALDYNKTMDCGTKVKIFSLGYCPQEFTGNVTVTY